jgi:hypothetical protein
MGYLFILAVVALLGWVNVATVRLIRREQARAGWWVALVVAGLVGAGMGVWGGFFFEYQPSPRLRVFGAPVPAAFLHWEGPPGEEDWVDFVTPAPALFAGSNVLLLALLAACPIGLVFWLWRWVAPARGRPSAGASGPADRGRHPGSSESQG